MLCAVADSRFKIIAVTLPDSRREEMRRETDCVVSMLLGGVDRVHLRKPGAPESYMRRFIETIPAPLRLHISLHSHHNLAIEYGCGVHLNAANPLPPEGFAGTLSRSCHSVSEVEQHSPHTDYVFLSPIFDSISKPGYTSAFSPENLSGLLSRYKNVIALGGVTPEKFGILERYRFAGAAMLGRLWQNTIRYNMLQFITHRSERHPDECEGARLVLEGGCRWIQLRMKGASDDEILHKAKELRDLCDRYGAVMILDDRADLVEATGADGVHLGKNDMPVAEARAMLGPDRIIGATANTSDDIKEAAAAGADYIGLGPYRFTTTKEKLSPVLGTDGYRRILADCREAGIEIPVVAIGGILPDDVAPLLDAGVSGVAISGAILNADDPVAMTRSFLKAGELFRES